LEALETITGLGFLADDVEDGVDELGSFSVVAFGPVVTSAGLTEDEVVRSEDLTEGARTDGVHCSGFQVHENGSGDVTTTGGFIVVDVDTLELEIGVAVVSASGVDSVLV
jgi:hypothetical protein